jgi:hypothetical protein
VNHTLTLVFVDRPETTRFCLDRVGISSDIGSGYVPEVLDPPAGVQERGMSNAKREVGVDQGGLFHHISKHFDSHRL